MNLIESKSGSLGAAASPRPDVPRTGLGRFLVRLERPVYGEEKGNTIFRLVPHGIVTLIEPESPGLMEMVSIVIGPFREEEDFGIRINGA
jgi:hypothetical protein